MFAHVRNFVPKEQCRLIADAMEEDDRNVPFNIHPCIGTYCTKKLELSYDLAYTKIKQPLVQNAIRLIVQRFSFNEVSIHLMGLQLTPEGTGSSGWHQDKGLRYVGLIILTDGYQYDGGELLLRDIRTKNVVWGPERLEQGDLLVFDDNQYEHNRLSCFANANTKCIRRTLLNLKVNSKPLLMLE